ncbi:MAG: DUF2799 domain-containing protein [Thermodesulfobacteriota bacterium]
MILKKWAGTFCALSAILAVVSCATLSKEECQTADWYQIGLIDGSKGREYHHIAKHNKACSEYGIRPDFDRYSQGRTEGLKHFCTREKGFKEGEKNGADGSVCPPESRNAFMEGYQVGIQVYTLKERISKIESEMDKYRHQRKETKDPEKLDLLNTLISKLARERDEIEDMIADIRTRNGF